MDNPTNTKQSSPLHDQPIQVGTGTGDRRTLHYWEGMFSEAARGQKSTGLDSVSEGLNGNRCSRSEKAILLALALTASAIP